MTVLVDRRPEVAATAAKDSWHVTAAQHRPMSFKVLEHEITLQLSWLDEQNLWHIKKGSKADVNGRNIIGKANHLALYLISSSMHPNISTYAFRPTSGRML
jgi:hypothetical protein